MENMDTKVNLDAILGFPSISGLNMNLPFQRESFLFWSMLLFNHLSFNYPEGRTEAYWNTLKSKFKMMVFLFFFPFLEKHFPTTWAFLAMYSGLWT